MSVGDGGFGAVRVQRSELATQDMGVIAELMASMYAQHRARLRATRNASPEMVNQAAVAGSLTTGMVRTPGVEYQASEADAGCPMGMLMLEGNGEVSAGREHLVVTPGGGFLAPGGRPYDAVMRDTSMALVQVPWPVVSELAESRTGLPAGTLRFTSMGPVSADAAALWANTVRIGCQQLISSGDQEISALVIQHLAEVTAAAMLEVFPNTTMTVPYLPGPGWAAPEAVRRAAEFMTAHAAQPLTMTQIAAAAGVTPRALQDAFRRHYGMTPAAYLRRVRLERAHLDLHHAQPGDGVTVAAVARAWGWASPSRFTAAYQQRFGVRPSHTLRT